MFGTFIYEGGLRVVAVPGLEPLLRSYTHYIHMPTHYGMNLQQTKKQQLKIVNHSEHNKILFFKNVKDPNWDICSTTIPIMQCRLQIWLTRSLSH